MSARPVILCLLLSSGFFTARSQELLLFRQGSIDWADIEKKPTPAQVNAFVTQNRKDFPQFYDKRDEVHYHTLDDLKTSLHFIDLDGDHQLDVIYDGISGGEPNDIDIYLKRGNTYQLVFSTGQHIMHMDWLNGRLHKLYLQDDGCCDDPVTTDKIYQVDYPASRNPKFIQIYQGFEIRGTKFPDTLEKKPWRFEVLNPNYNIRSKPAVDDTSKPEDGQIEGHPYFGNSLGLLAKGARGTALAKTTDATGREWWFVVIDEESYPPAGGFFLPEPSRNEFPTRITGWISSRFVKPL